MKTYPHYLTEIAQQLRRRATRSERILWQRLRRHQLNGMHFSRQHRIGRYIVDFYCRDLRLVVELEGGIHEESKQKEYDEERFYELNIRGLQVLRIKSEEVEEDVDKVLEKILNFEKMCRKDLPA